MKKYLLPSRFIAFLFIIISAFSGASQAFASSAWQVVGTAGFTAGTSADQPIAVDSSNHPYIAFQDGSQGGKASVMEYIGGTWSLVGSAGFSSSTPNFTNLKLDASNHPYIAYRDLGNGGKATVMMYNGTSWQDVGPVGFSAGGVNNVSFAIATSTGNPYIAYTDVATSSAATVMTYSAGSWSNVGSSGFSSSTAVFTSLALDYSNHPYVAYQDAGNSNKLTVMHYNGTSWQDVGGVGVSPGVVNSAALALDSSGNPYVAFEDGSSSNKATVMEYTAGSWNVVGTADFTSGAANYMTLAMDSSGHPYVAFQDPSNSNKATVMMYNGTSWQIVGTAGFSSAAAVNNVQIAMDGNNTPYVAYEDTGSSNKATVMEYTALPTYTLSFNTQGGSTVSPQSVQQSNVTTLPSNVTRAGYYFNDWNTAADGSGTSYPAGASYTMPGSATTLYAIWTAVVVPVVTGSTSGGGIAYGCKDPAATNYSEFVASNPSLCVYGGTPAVTASTSVPFTPGGPRVSAVPATPSSAAPLFKRNLERGMSGTDVTALQEFLIAANAGTSASALSAGGATTYFGSLTKAALIEYQKAHGITPAAGYLGRVTRAYIESHS